MFFFPVIVEDLFVAYFNYLLCILAHLTSEKSDLNAMHLCLYIIDIFADQDCLLFVIPKHFPIVCF